MMSPIVDLAYNRQLGLDAIIDDVISSRHWRHQGLSLGQLAVMLEFPYIICQKPTYLQDSC